MSGWWKNNALDDCIEVCRKIKQVLFFAMPKAKQSLFIFTPHQILRRVTAHFLMINSCLRAFFNTIFHMNMLYAYFHIVCGVGIMCELYGAGRKTMLCKKYIVLLLMYHKSCMYAWTHTCVCVQAHVCVLLLHIKNIYEKILLLLLCNIAVS